MNRYRWGWTWIIFAIVIFAVSIALTLWAYDGDWKCLVAECRRMKD